mmetsp:Transcript_75174/g.132876  ORF Transcript_75174/g.132876 Transcript_75174/m.132876 type:complete len:101 (-) Transcript_75174:373-675(-)
MAGAWDSSRPPPPTSASVPRSTPTVTPLMILPPLQQLGGGGRRASTATHSSHPLGGGTDASTPLNLPCSVCSWTKTYGMELVYDCPDTRSTTPPHFTAPS